ncbi:MAG: hypothetical protein J1E63_09185 [Muribaculaceae bacterium]|nr:hypothetical protein [Muribaculaceae bacterium]
MKKILFAIIVALCSITASAQIETGYRGFADIGYGISTSEISDGIYSADVSNYLTISTTHGYQVIENYLFVGAGVGLEYWHEGSAVSIPIFADVRSDFYTANRFSIFGDLKIGYRANDAQGLTINPQVGVRFALNDNIGLNLGVGSDIYKIQDLDGTGSAFTIKLGVDF